MTSDAELLQRYVTERTESAFAELVRRHLDLVYAAALRRTNGRHALAEEITQQVFTDLARKSARLTHHPSLTGWLYRSTRYVAIDAIRAEQRRQKLAQTMSTMADEPAIPDSPLNWDQLRPFLDESLDELKETDREVMLLRFFQGLTFAEVGACLNLSENAARMRTERALEKLRTRLGRRGLTSLSSLSVLLANQCLLAAPARLAFSVTTTALAAEPAGALAVWFTKLSSSKISAVCLSASVAAGLATIAWGGLAQNVSEAEMKALRTENVRLKQAATPGMPSATVQAVADEIAAQTTTHVQTIRRRLATVHPAGSGGHQNHGQSTPRDAIRSLGWAADSGDVEAVVRILHFDKQGLEMLEAIHTGMPEGIRTQYRTPEELGAFFYIAGTLLQPVPGADIWEKKTAAAVTTDLAPDRVLLRQPRQTQGGMEVVQTPEGWRIEIPSDQIEEFVARILSNEMLAKLGLN